jgi:PAS domain S-box-containing protein
MKRPDEAAWLAAIVASADASIISTDLDGTITSWNPAAERMYGYTAPEIVGQSNGLLIPPDRRDEEAAVRQRMTSGQPVEHYETVRVRKDGSRIQVAMTVSPLHARDGTIIGISRISRDISEQTRIDAHWNASLDAARRLAAIVASSDDAIIGMSLDGTITAWNHAAERMYGYPAIEAIGQSIRLLVPEDRQREESEVLDRIRQGERVQHFETTRRRKDGICIPVSLSMSPIRDDTGTVIGASKIARDITERKRSVERAAFLAEMGALLAGSLEYATTLKTVATIVSCRTLSF